MSQYSTGLVSTTNGSSVITGTSTAWLTSGIDASDFFIAAGDTVAYTIASIDSDTQITLTANYAGSTQSGITYTAHIERFGALPIFSDNDADTPELMNEVVKFTVNKDSALGTASTKDTGTAAGEVPLNSSLVPKAGGTFTGDIAATNLSGTNTGDQDLSGKADIAGQVFTGDITYYGGGGVSSNTSYGTQSLNSNTTGSDNTATGRSALANNTTGNYNTANGRDALYSNTTGDFNTATGREALYSNTEGAYNTANGRDALYSNTTGDFNTATGYKVLRSNTEGGSNTATGREALFSNTEGNNNTANGREALYSNTTGNSNTANGRNALYNNTTGFENTANGYQALYSNTEGAYNTANGRDALYSNTTGNNNTASGYRALSSNTSYDNVSGLGYDSAVTGSNQVSLGDSSTTVYTQSGTVSSRSDLRDKADVRDTILGLDFITALRPVDYRWDLRDDYKPDAPTEPEPLKDDATEQDIQAHELALSQYENDHAEWLLAVKHENLIHDGTHTRNRYHHGIIAQEIAGVIAESGVDFGGYQDHKVNGGEDVLTIAYSELIGPLVKALQEVNQKFDALKEEFDDYVETHP